MNIFSWKDEDGCVYSPEGLPEGWIVPCEDDLDHFYDLDGHYLPTDIDEAESKMPKHEKDVKLMDDYAQIGNSKYEYEEDGWYMHLKVFINLLVLKMIRDASIMHKDNLLGG